MLWLGANGKRVDVPSMGGISLKTQCCRGFDHRMKEVCRSSFCR